MKLAINSIVAIRFKKYISIILSGKKRVSKPDEYFLSPIFDEDVPPPKQPVPPTHGLSGDKLLLKTPLVLVENQKDANAMELQQYCYNQPIVLIHGLTLALKIDLSQFSTKTLIQTAPDHEVITWKYFQFYQNQPNTGRS